MAPLTKQEWGVYSRRGILLAVRECKFDAVRWKAKWGSPSCEVRRIS